MSDSSRDGVSRSGAASSVGAYRPPHMRLLLSQKNPEEPSDESSPQRPYRGGGATLPNYFIDRRSTENRSVSVPQVRPRRSSGTLDSLRPKFSVTCFSARNVRNSEPESATDMESVILERFYSNQQSWVPDSLQHDNLQIFLFHSRVPSSSGYYGSGKPSGDAHESILGASRHVVSSAPSSASAWSPAGATTARTDGKTCGDWRKENYSDVISQSLKQIADSTREGVSPLPRLKIEARVAKCFFKHFVFPGAAGKRSDGRAPLSPNSSSSFSIPELEELLSNRRLIHQAIAETTTVDNIANAQEYLRQARGFENLSAPRPSECKIVIHFLDTFSKDDTPISVTIRYSADDPKMPQRSDEQQRHDISELTDGLEVLSVSEKDGGQTVLEQQYHDSLSEAGRMEGELEQQQCADDIKLKQYRKTRGCLLQFLREGRGADFRLSVITKNQVTQESSTVSDPAVLEWAKQAWDSRSAGSLVFPESSRFKVFLVRYKDIIHRYHSKNLKVSLLKIRQVDSEDTGCQDKVKNFWEVSLQIKKNMVPEAKNLVEMEHIVNELLEEAIKLTQAMGEVYIPC